MEEPHLLVAGWRFRPWVRESGRLPIGRRAAARGRRGRGGQQILAGPLAQATGEQAFVKGVQMASSSARAPAAEHGAHGPPEDAQVEQQ